jgi:hypothetical protein
MITYELAKQLKDAGFPNNCERYFAETDGVVRVVFGSILKLQSDTTGLPKANYCPAPNLSELIEACGDKLTFISKRHTTDNKWVVGKFLEYYELGDTLEEAVANLWLALKNNRPSAPVELKK